MFFFKVQYYCSTKKLPLYCPAFFLFIVEWQPIISPVTKLNNGWEILLRNYLSLNIGSSFWEYFFSKHFLRVDSSMYIVPKIGGGVHLYCRHRRWGRNRDRNILVYLRSFLEKSTSLLYLYTNIACACINQMLNRKSFCIICLVCL